MLITTILTKFESREAPALTPFADHGQICKFSMLQGSYVIVFHAKCHQCICIMYIIMHNHTNLDNFGNGTPVLTPLYYHNQIWHTEADRQCTLTCKISCGSVYSIALERQKP